MKAEVAMKHSEDRARGTKRIVKKCREEFRQKENLNYYGQEDIKQAERKFIKFCLSGKS